MALIMGQAAIAGTATALVYGLNTAATTLAVNYIVSSEALSDTIYW